jgi:hypothetical protein
MTYLDEFLQLPIQDGGVPLWSSGNIGLRGQMFEIYAAEEFQTGGPSASDILLHRKVNDVGELLQHVRQKPILISDAAFDTLKNIQPFALSDLMTSVGSLGNIRAISGPAAAKILLEVDALPQGTKNGLQPFLATVYQEEPVKAGSRWRPAPLDEKARRQFALMAFLHGLHTLAAVTVPIDPSDSTDRIPTLQSTLPMRYMWVVGTLAKQSAESGDTLFGIKRPELAHFFADMFESLAVPLPEGATGELADTAKLLKFLQTPVEIWEQVIEGKMLATAAKGTQPSSNTPRGMEELPTPTGTPTPTAPSMEELPTSGGYSVSDILNAYMNTMD